MKKFDIIFKYLTLTLLFFYTFIWGVISHTCRYAVATTYYHDYEGVPIPLLSERLLLEFSSCSLFSIYSAHLKFFLILFIIFLILNLILKLTQLQFLQISFFYFIFITTCGIIFAFVTILVYLPHAECLTISEKTSTTLCGLIIHYTYLTSVIILILNMIIIAIKKVKANFEG